MRVGLTCLVLPGIAGAFSEELGWLVIYGSGAALLIAGVRLARSVCPRCGNPCFRTGSTGWRAELNPALMPRFILPQVGWSRCWHCSTKLDWTDEDLLHVTDGSR